MLDFELDRVDALERVGVVRDPADAADRVPWEPALFQILDEGGQEVDRALWREGSLVRADQDEWGMLTGRGDECLPEHGVPVAVLSGGIKGPSPVKSAANQFLVARFRIWQEYAAGQGESLAQVLLELTRNGIDVELERALVGALDAEPPQLSDPLASFADRVFDVLAVQVDRLVKGNLGYEQANAALARLAQQEPSGVATQEEILAECVGIKGVVVDVRFASSRL